jgi:hypothetical protein
MKSCFTFVIYNAVCVSFLANFTVQISGVGTLMSTVLAAYYPPLSIVRADSRVFWISHSLFARFLQLAHRDIIQNVYNNHASVILP